MIYKPSVVIIGHSSTLRLGVVRAVSVLGSEITLIVLTGFYRKTKRLDKRKPFDCFSKYISNVFYCHAADEKELIQLLLNKCIKVGEKVVLLSTSDVSTVIIDENKECLEKYFYFPYINSSKSIRFWMQKQNQQELARKLGLNVPKSTIIDIKEHTFEVPDSIKYPCFTKALISIAGGKRFFRRCNDKNELTQVLEIIAKDQDARILVEDYKIIEKEYAVMGFSDGKQVIFPGVISLKSHAVSHFGVAMTGVILPVNGYEELLEKFKIFVLQIGFIGVFDIDFYYSENQFYFGEINLRFGGSGYAITKLGVNLPAMLVRHLYGEDISGMKKNIETSASYVNERMCEDDWYRGYISTTQYHNLISSADISFVKDAEDSRPQVKFNQIHKIQVVKKMFKKILYR